MGLDVKETDFVLAVAVKVELLGVLLDRRIVQIIVEQLRVVLGQFAVTVDVLVEAVVSEVLGRVVSIADRFERVIFVVFVVAVLFDDYSVSADGNPRCEPGVVDRDAVQRRLDVGLGRRPLAIRLPEDRPLGSGGHHLLACGVDGVQFAVTGPVLCPDGTIVAEDRPVAAGDVDLVGALGDDVGEADARAVDADGLPALAAVGGLVNLARRVTDVARLVVEEVDPKRARATAWFDNIPPVDAAFLGELAVQVLARAVDEMNRLLACRAGDGDRLPRARFFSFGAEWSVNWSFSTS